MEGFSAGAMIWKGKGEREVIGDFAAITTLAEERSPSPLVGEGGGEGAACQKDKCVCIVEVRKSNGICPWRSYRAGEALASQNPGD
jgi:hypothetical protein